MKYFAFIFLFFSQKLWAAACCGGGGSLPQMILGDSRYQVSTSLTTQNYVADVDTKGLAKYRSQDSSDQSTGLSLSAAYQWMWRLQSSLSFSYKERQVEGPHKKAQKDQNFGDTDFSTAYEVLPEITYSPWVPRVFLYAKVSAPTGKSVYETQANEQVTGSGFWYMGPGLVFYKLQGLWDYTLALEVQKGFSRQFASLQIDPGIRSKALVAIGRSFDQWRLGFSLGPTWEEGKKMTTNAQSLKGESSYWWDGQLSLHYAFNDAHALALSFSDQTLWGKSKNTAVGQSAALAYIFKSPL